MRNFCNIFIILMVTFNIGGCIDCGYRLKWTPRNYDRVFMAFINDFNCPKWTTRHPGTKKTIAGNTKIVLPRGVPFAFLCGACHSLSNPPGNLTLKTKGAEADFKAINSSSSSSSHVLSDYNKQCLVSYGITAPITGKGGIFECQLNRITQKTETISFTVRNVNVEEQPQINITLTQKNEKTSLRCPEPKLKSNNIVYVWHSYLEDLKDEQQHPAKIIWPSLEPNISYSSSKFGVQLVSCSTYDFMNPRTVWRITYKIEELRAKEDRPKPTLTPNGQPLTSDSPNWYRNPIIWLGIVAGFVVIVGIVISVGQCTNCFKKKISPTGNENSSLWINRQNAQNQKPLQ